MGNRLEGYGANSSGQLQFPMGGGQSNYNVMSGYGVGNQNQAQLPQVNVGGDAQQGWMDGFALDKDSMFGNKDTQQGWMDGFNLSKDSMFGNKESMGWLNGGASVLGNLASIYQGNKQLGIAEDSLESQQAFANRNLANNATAYNDVATRNDASRRSMAADKQAYDMNYGTKADFAKKNLMNGTAIG